MKVVINGPVRDILSFVGSINRRKRIFKKESAAPREAGLMNQLAESLHPLRQKLVIDSIREENRNTRTYRLRGFHRNPSRFIPGQYIAIGFRLGPEVVWRPFSISSSPEETAVADGKGQGFYEITVQKSERGGFVAEHIWNGWKKGVMVTATGPAGTFFHQRLRDSGNLVCLAGGSGITPFKPMIEALLRRDAEARVLLFQGARSADDLIFSSFWKELEKEFSGRFFHIPVLSEAGGAAAWAGDTGFITGELIRRRQESKFPGLPPEVFSYFICGPEGLHRFSDIELKALEIPGRRVRREHYPAPSSPSKVCYNLTVRLEGVEQVVEADGEETVLTALERGGFNPPSLCRSGECGWCRSRLISGSVVPACESGGLRMADSKFGYFHPCSVYPSGDLTIELPSNPITRSEL